MQWFKRTVIGLLCLMSALCFVGPFWYNANHPEMTQMQVLIMFWKDFVLSALAGAGACFVANSE